MPLPEHSHAPLRPAQHRASAAKRDSMKKADPRYLPPSLSPRFVSCMRLFDSPQDQALSPRPLFLPYSTEKAKGDPQSRRPALLSSATRSLSPAKATPVLR